MPPKAVASRPAAKKKAPIHKLPDPIRDGEIVRDIQKRQWRLGKSIGVGGFGEIYAGSMMSSYFHYILSNSCIDFHQRLTTLTNLSTQVMPPM